MTKQEFYDQIGEELAELVQETRSQDPVNDQFITNIHLGHIVGLVDTWVAEVIGEDDVHRPNQHDPNDNHWRLNVERKNRLRAEQRAKAGVNKQTKKGI